MLVGSCKERIIGKISQLTTVERKLADYIISNYEDIIGYNVAELAKASGVSDATVVRFCRSVGYKGFTDFKMNAARDLIPKEGHFYPNIQKGDSPADICTKMFQSEINVLNRTLSTLDMETMDRVALHLYKAKVIYIFGTGGSNTVALDAQHKFTKLGIKAIAHGDVDMQFMLSSTMSADDVAIGISFSGSNNHVNTCIKNAKACGAYCIGIVSQGKSPIVKLVDDIIYSASDETTFQSESISTRIAQLAIIDALIGIMSFKDYDYYYERIGLTRDATSISKM